MQLEQKLMMGVGMNTLHFDHCVSWCTWLWYYRFNCTWGNNSKVSKVKLRLLFCHPPQLRPVFLGLWDNEWKPLDVIQRSRQLGQSQYRNTKYVPPMNKQIHFMKENEWPKKRFTFFLCTASFTVQSHVCGMALWCFETPCPPRNVLMGCDKIILECEKGNEMGESVHLLWCASCTICKMV